MPEESRRQKRTWFSSWNRWMRLIRFRVADKQCSMFIWYFYLTFQLQRKRLFFGTLQYAKQCIVVKCLFLVHSYFICNCHQSSHFFNSLRIRWIPFPESIPKIITGKKAFIIFKIILYRSSQQKNTSMTNANEENLNFYNIFLIDFVSHLLKSSKLHHYIQYICYLP